MPKKILFSIIFILSILSLSLTSCLRDNVNRNDPPSSSDDVTDDNTSDNNEEQKPGNKPVNENAIWGEGIYLRIVVKNGEDAKFNYNSLANDITDITGTPVFAVTDSTEISDHEFIFGQTNRPLSIKAYELLKELVTDVMVDGWLIYTEGTSAAVAYTTKDALNQSLEYIKNNFYSKAELVFEKSGVVDYVTYDLVEIADYERRLQRDKAFKKIEEELGADVRDAVEKLYTLYNSETYYWIANLYDPGIGGFYFSNTGRDNLGFLPDLESTAQALSHLNTGGMFSDVGGYRYALPEEMKAAILNFAKSMQDPEDGYFYHPQWGYRNELVRDDYKNARRGRDLGWARSLIKTLWGKPYWDTPAGDIGELGAPGASQTALTNRLSASKIIAVSKIIATASTGILPAHLQSIDAWKAYIESLNIVNDPYMAGNTLAAQHNEIANAGSDYIDYLTAYLTEKQNPETGFWGDGISYTTMNGFMKLSYSFFYYKRTIPGIEKALDSTMQMLLTPDTDAHDLHICNTYNTWENFVLILDSAEQTGGEEMVASLRAKLISKAPDLINITYDKVKTHKRKDGGFSYNEKRPCNFSQQAPVACATVIEGDVNGTGLSSTAITSTMAKALGFDMPPLYVPADADVFLRLIEQRTPLDKTESKEVLPNVYIGTQEKTFKKGN